MSNYELRRSMAQALWLNYFNQTLFEKGVITERQRNQLKCRIMARHPLPSTPKPPPCGKL